MREYYGEKIIEGKYSNKNILANQQEVFSAINELLLKRQSNSVVEMKDNSDADEIKKFKQLLDDGIITQEEFELKKKKLLGL